MIEAIVSHTRYRVGDGNGGQAGATIEATIFQARYGVGEGNGGQAGATTEAELSQARYLVLLSIYVDGFGDNYFSSVFVLIRIVRIPSVGHSRSLVFII